MLSLFTPTFVRIVGGCSSKSTPCCRKQTVISTITTMEQCLPLLTRPRYGIGSNLLSQSLPDHLRRQFSPISNSPSRLCRIIFLSLPIGCGSIRSPARQQLHPFNLHSCRRHHRFAEISFEHPCFGNSIYIISCTVTESHRATVTEEKFKENMFTARELRQEQSC